MSTLFRCLLYLYPAAYRAEYGEEILSVLDDRTADIQAGALVQRVIFRACESGGLLLGALREHLRIRNVLPEFPIPQRRPIMRSDFRFPKSTVTLMSIILVAIIVAIEKAENIQRSIAAANPAEQFHLDNFSIVGALLSLLLIVAAVAAIVWAVLYVLHRSGVQRLADLNPSASPRSKTGLLG